MVETPFFVERLLSLSDMYSCVESILPFTITDCDRRVEGVTTENAIEEHARSKRAMIERTKAFIFFEKYYFCVMDVLRLQERDIDCTIMRAAFETKGR
mmetsp:Transcript_15988/g.21028  ORF Transcript_15988/g.21028 Transcript_15988/m.21028 type:complete len:98 (-) Transcript_15988:161-454(-)